MKKPANTAAQFADIAYQPQDPKTYHPAIGLIGCGAITEYHLRAYKNAEYQVTALCDLDVKAAAARRDEFFPDAAVFSDHRELLADKKIEVVDVTTHPEVRGRLIEESIAAGKHVLSQKPFVLDLDEGERLAKLAEKKGVKLAVNQNARWAPHFSYMREAVWAGEIGQVASVHCGVHWNHEWVKGTPFESIYHLMLYDFAIHWFDFLTTIMAGDGNNREEPTRVFASTTKSPTQEIKPALLAQVAVEYPTAQATLVFDGHTEHGQHNHTFISGTEGTLRSSGIDENRQTVQFSKQGGTFSPVLEGMWFPDGFHGTMGELLCAIEQKREPSNSARNNLHSLALCFAAIESAQRGVPVVPGTVRKLPEPPW
ncbi:Gfo/Idh/MocA family protein [Adhaeretor mobilis]|uniref:Inositol 2-dehydrogenase n=1 Tax=Adhaeretor mobilis TaxID=1930276 RepID=A0A517MUY3_9BACT|nr:Gfo/Idh/MocA family oxidoreductase [Adhaeretor mobilis]QDS98688.1 Inositol 2-dehydrogenase [Adhaeretor mobilis]